MNSFLIVILIMIFIFVLFYQFKNPETLDSKYQVLQIRNLLTEQECKELIDLARRSNMVESSVVEGDTLYKMNKDFRKSYQCWMTPSQHPVLNKLSKISVDLTGFPVSNQEQIQIVKYDKEGKFDAHFDACVLSDKLCKEMNRGAGERRTTLIVYLNEDIVGGETEFVNLNQKIIPETGKGILFWSTDDQDHLLLESKHKGNKVEQGEKWIATVWSHGKSFQ